MATIVAITIVIVSITNLLTFINTLGAMLRFFSLLNTYFFYNLLTLNYYLPSL